MKPTKFDAILALVGGQIVLRDGGTPIYLDGQTPPTDADIDTKLTELVNDWHDQEYARNRKEEYNALCQFELMTDDAINDTTTHLDAIAAIKAKWPKDNSGPV